MWCSVLRSANAEMLAVGFMPEDVGHKLPSKMNRLSMSWLRPH